MTALAPEYTGHADLISDDELREIAGRPNGTNILLDLVREGRVMPADAVQAIDQLPRTRESRFKSLLMALAGILFAR